jgi:hypothetical protein
VEEPAVKNRNPNSQRYSSVVEHHDGLITRHVDY